MDGELNKAPQEGPVWPQPHHVRDLSFNINVDDVEEFRKFKPTGLVLKYAGAYIYIYIFFYLGILFVQIHFGQQKM